MRSPIVAIVVFLCAAVPASAELVLTADERRADPGYNGTYGFLDGADRRDTDITRDPIPLLSGGRSDPESGWFRFLPGFDMLGEIRVLHSRTRDLFFRF